MSTISFYTQYRPKQFNQVVGHTRIITVLQHQLLTGSFHHAYLLAGASGSGKTTCARILASALCCQSPLPDGSPCGVCQICSAISNNEFWDVLELDGARYRSVEDVDALTRNAHLYPHSRHKVYIIDECHMLSTTAWTSLLKLLEEPPPYLVIILCTTDSKKIPETISSRCQVLLFEDIADNEIVAKLDYICRDLGFVLQVPQKQYIVATAKHNMRTAENLLENVYNEYLALQISKLRKING